MIWLALLVASVFVWSDNATLFPSVLAKEIEATHEWQLIGENDTLPAGLHIRMDMTTGQKWAKLPDDINEDEYYNQSTPEKDHSQPQQRQVSVSMTGETTSSSIAVQVENSNPPLSSSDKKEETLPMDKQEEDSTLTTTADSYDYEMMHRTLQQLPPEEQARMGGIPPPLPSSSSSSRSNDKERAAWEAQLRTIWEQRQVELQKLQESQVADLPQILKDRVASIQHYLQHPQIHFETHQTRSNGPPTSSNNDNSIEEEDDDEETVNGHDIVQVLADLEYLLTDIDMARDFYTMGGWPLLVSLLGPQEELIRVAEQKDGNNAWQSFVHDVQSHAAWVVGTAVKNTPEFHAWSIEPLVPASDFSSSHKAVSALDLLQQGLQLDGAPEGTSASHVAVQQKFVYSLGACLRGNPLAQRQFAKPNLQEEEGSHGFAVLAQALQDEWLPCSNLVSPSHNEDDNKKETRHCTKMALRILSLVSDVLVEVEQATHSEQTHQQGQQKGGYPRVRVENDPTDGSNDVALLLKPEEWTRIEQAVLDNAPVWCKALDQILQQQTNARSSTTVALQGLASFGTKCTKTSDFLSRLWTAAKESDSSLSSRSGMDDREALHQALETALHDKLM